MAAALVKRLVAGLLGHGASVIKTDLKGLTPLDRAILGGDATKIEGVRAVANRLIHRSAAVTPRAAAARGTASDRRR